MTQSITVDSFPTLSLLDYKDARAQIQSGDILLCAGSSLVSNLIQKATKSVWSHVGFIVKVEDIDRIMVMESVETVGVRTVPLSHYVENYNGTGKGYNGKLLIARHSQFKPEMLRGLSRYAVDLFGYPYSNEDLFKIATRISMMALGMSHFEPIEPDKAFICSEYAYECFKSVGIDIQWDKGGFIAPVDFARDPRIGAVCELKTKEL